MSSDKKPQWKFIECDRDANSRMIAKGTLKYGLKINGVAHKEFVMREPVTGDLLDAELIASTRQALNYNTALISKTLIRVGDYEGAVTVGMVRELKQADFLILREAQSELSLAGELEQ